MKLIKLFFCLLLTAPLTLLAQSPVSGAWKTMVPGQDGSIMPIKLVIADNGTYQVDFGMDGTIEIYGTSETNGDQMSITDTKGDRSCPNQTGVYKCKVEGNSFTMTRVSDPCEGRGGPEGKMEWTRL